MPEKALTGVPVRYQPPFTLPNEFALAAACCRWAYSGHGTEQVERLAQRTDWARFVETCRRHRVQGLAWRALHDMKITMPAPAGIALGSDAGRIAEHGLRAAAESQRLAEAFAADGVAILFLKGLTLGKLAYGDPFLKMGWDIDLLAAPDDVAHAASLLGRLGYEVTLPRRASALARWHRSRKESAWVNGDGLVVELHSRVVDQPQLLPRVSVRSPSRAVAVTAGIELPTFADQELFAYLCVHGASSAWFRLKWVADLAGLLHARDPQAIEQLYGRARELGAGQAPAQALILAQWLFDIPISDSLADEIDRPTGRRLARAALRELLHDEPTKRPFGTRAIHLTQFLLLPGWRYKWSELGRQARVGAGLF